MATSIPQPERKWEQKFYRECLHFSVFPNTWKNPKFFCFVHKILIVNNSKCTSALWIYTILLDAVQYKKKAILTKKRHFEYVFERHMQRLKRIFWNYPKRKMFQEENYLKRTRDQHASEMVTTAKVFSGLKTPSSFNITWKKLFDFFVQRILIQVKQYSSDCYFLFKDMSSLFSLLINYFLLTVLTDFIKKQLYILHFLL